MMSFLKAVTAILLLLPALGSTAQNSKPTEVQVTPYKTTFIANGKDETVLMVKIIDQNGKDQPAANLPIVYKVIGDARIASINGNANVNKLRISDSTWKTNLHGTTRIVLKAGNKTEHIKFEAKADSLWPGATEIHAVKPGKPHKVTNGIYKAKTTTDKILGADISFLPELEAKGVKFSVDGVEKDAIEILKEHGFNYIRLRIFNDPAQPKGYSPNAGFCDLEHTKQMAKRVKAAGLKLLLDFHYSDYWADPQQQYKPKAWEGKNFEELKTAVHDFTVDVMQHLKAQGTTPDMVQVGNEINHGMIWPDAHIGNLDTLAQLLYSGVKGVQQVSPQSIIMLHVALGGQELESQFFYDAMRDRNVPYDVIGLSYYPKWHGTPADLKNNLALLSKKYNKQIMVAEYTMLKREVNDIAFNVAGGKGIGSFIWEPLSTWEMIFEKDGKANNLINIYPEIAKKYHISLLPDVMK